MLRRLTKEEVKHLQLARLQPEDVMCIRHPETVNQEVRQTQP